MKKVIMSLALSIATIIAFNSNLAFAKSTESDEKLLREFSFLKHEAIILKNNNDKLTFAKATRAAGKTMVVLGGVAFAVPTVMNLLHNVDYIDTHIGTKITFQLGGLASATVGGIILLLTTPSETGDSTMTAYLLEDKNMNSLLAMSDLEMLSYAHEDSKIGDKILAVATILHGK